MPCKAAIFDLDGTLINSLEDLADSANATLVAYGFPTHPVDAYKYFVGDGAQKLIERILPKAKAGDAALVAEVLARYKATYDTHTEAKTRPYPGIQAMLAKLHGLGIPLGVCTNKYQANAEEILGHFFPAGTFRSVYGDRPDLPRKPDPKKVLLMAKDYGVRPEEVAYLGDTSIDIETAKNAGALPIGVLWGFRTKEELLEHGAKVLLANPEEIFEKVEFARA